MSSPAWFVEVASPSYPGALLEWRQAAIGSLIYAFVEAERSRADRIAIELSEMLGDAAVVRVRHRIGAERGTFFPRPLPARRVYIQTNA